MTRTCCVPRCKSGYPSQEGKADKVSLFKVPKDKDALERWSRAIRRKDRKLTSSDFVCALHFREHEIIRFFDAEKTLERVSPILSQGAVPSQFPNCPKYLSKQTRSPRKSWRQRAASRIPAVKKAKIQVKDSNSHIDGTDGAVLTTLNELNTRNQANGTDELDESNTCSQAGGTDYELGELNTRSLGTDEAVPTTLDGSSFTVGASVINPNLQPLIYITFEQLVAETFNQEKWSKFMQEKRIRYLYWPENETLCTKYVEIDKNLNVKVAFGNVCTGFVGYKKIYSLYQFNQLIEMVEKANICRGAILNKYTTWNKRCGGYAKRAKNWCGYCAKRNILSKESDRIMSTTKARGRNVNQNTTYMW